MTNPASSRCSLTFVLSLLLMNFLATFAHATLVNVPVGSVSDLLIQSALSSLNDNSPTGSTYRSGNLIRAQKLLRPEYVIYKLSLNLEPNCNEGASCPREACTIDLRQHEHGVIDLESDSIQCMYLHPHTDRTDAQPPTFQDGEQQQESATSGQEPEATIESFERRTSNASLQLDHEVQTVADGTERPFVAVRATDRNYCAGCPYELNPSLPGLAAYNEQVVQSMDDTGRSEFKHRVVSIVRVTRAVPPGSNVVLYELLLEIGETSCPRTSISARADCPLSSVSPIRLCLVAFEQRPWQQDSRKIVRNNCTDLPVTYNELTSESTDERSPTSDSLYTSESSSTDARTSARKEIIEGSQLEENKKKVRVPEATYKEFDDFLKNIDFDGPTKIREREPEEPTGTPVTEEVIRPKVAERPRRSAGADVPGTERARDELVRELAQLAVDELDYIDVDDRRRVLLDILDSKTQPGDDSLHYITMRVATTNCPEGSTECTDHSRDEVKICRAQVQRASGRPDRVLQSQCYDEAFKGRDERTRRHLVGAPSPVSVDDPNVILYAKKGLRKHAQRRENEPFLVEILEATVQIVSGMKYKIKVSIGESTCPKGQRRNCTLRTDKPVKDYLITVWSQPWKDHDNPEITVEPFAGSIVRRSVDTPGGATPVSTDDPKIRAYAQNDLTKYAETFVGERTRSHLVGAPSPVSVDDPNVILYAKKGLRKHAQRRENEPFLVEILEATVQIVSGMKYKIKVSIGESTCAKGQRKHCTLRTDKPVKDYLITVWSQPWKDHDNPEITVEPFAGSIVRRSVDTPGGATPVRTDDPKIRAYAQNDLTKYAETFVGERTRSHLVGAPSPVRVDDPNVILYAKKGLRKHAQRRENEPFLVEILEATLQIVSGMKYKIKVSIGESTCAKGQRRNCTLRTDKPVKDYLITVWSQPWKDHDNPEITVEPFAGSIVRRSVDTPGGATPVSTDDPKIRAYAQNDLTKYAETFVGERTRSHLVGAPSPVSVDDPNVILYAKKGLRKHAQRRENEPFLVEILEATLQIVSGMKYKIKVSIGESTCAKGQRKHCTLRTDKPVKDYLITVWSQPWKDHDNPEITVEPFAGSIVRRSVDTPDGATPVRTDDPKNRAYAQNDLTKYAETFVGERTRSHLVGAPSPVSVDDPNVILYAKKGLRKHAQRRENEPFLVEILEATLQIVSGMKYKIKVSIGESTCAKGQRRNCTLRTDKPVKDYLITVWSQPWKDHDNPEITVEPFAGSIVRRSVGTPGGVTPVRTDDPKIRAYAQKGLTKYAETFVGENEPYLVDILESSEQVVAGKLYRIRVRLGESTCPKGTKENCQLKANGRTNDYLITVWSQPWRDGDDPQITVELYAENAKRSVSKRSLRGQHYIETSLQIAKEIADERAFEKFVNDHERTYESEEERNYRYEVFRKNMRKIEEFRENELGSAIYGATIFADLTPEEFRSRHLGLRPDLRSDNDVPLASAEIPDIELPTEFDWRHRNVVTEVKNQGACGSCWAFSVTGNVESLYAIKHEKLFSLSEQELVDCDKWDSGCEGGLPDNAYRAIEQMGGLELETDYPYDGADEKCHFDKSKVRVSVASGLNITSNETQMAQWLVQNGPMSIGINANAMQFYMGGISHPYKFLCSGDNLDHGVLIVGYGIHSYPIFKKKMPYWIIKNSWGPQWGEQGYYRVYRGDGTCGLNRMVTSAVIV